MTITITAHVDREHIAAFIDGFHEWARSNDVAPLLDTTTDTPTGEPESWYEIEIGASRHE